MANKNFPHAGKSTEINAIQENRNFENRNNENRDYLEETAAEAGAVESRNTNETYNYNNDADEAGGRNLGWLALALSIISLFVLPVLLGASGIIIGFIARRRGAENLGAWAIGIGIVSLLLGIFVLPFF
ncbi:MULTISPECIES: hypothetical protein [Aeribacillus]|jgi:hypothetical protein|uniref:DUF4190 domain-containing protein n=1 Tax=Aeribacillus pallidus TaxID=33936 RepID=A0A161ZT38_9BACI|nr:MULTISPECIES: hypothetical protein [Aeribacillus]ASS91930.1 hypothetical protein AP3564_18245 [Aeribacillus pallidus]KZM56777.1 hypothetical protein A3Q35_06960 [Aeribacillus pallidus]KZN96307.1 hypothetical protein AZI98_09630 [Aeribacillus pallidus]MDR9795772.1 DUF4190 domain-containing protein [Aeribacillus pallidus]